MRQTSITAYQQIRDNGLLNECQWAIYDLLFTNGPLTANEAHRLLAGSPKFANKPTITPRFAELEALGVIYAAYQRECAVSKRQCLVYDVTAKLPKEIPVRRREGTARLRKQIEKLKLENAALRLRLSRWGRPTKEEVAARNGGARTPPLFEEEVACK